MAARAWWNAVVKGQACVKCGGKRRTQGHHIIDVNYLRREYGNGAIWRIPSDGEPEQWCPALPHDLQEYVSGAYRSFEAIRWDERNGICLCEWPCHANHSTAVDRIKFWMLPAAAIEFADELGLQHRLGPRFYPDA